MCAGDELAGAASQSLNARIEYEEISHDKAREILDTQRDIDDSEKEYLLEYFSLIREGKTNYVSTIAFKYITSVDPTLPSEFFENYSEEFKPKKRKVTVSHRKGRGAAAPTHAKKEEHQVVPGHAPEDKSEAKEKTTALGKRARK